jgi:hypothetical protein
VTTQLRLVETPAPTPVEAAAGRPAKPARTTKPARRAANWGEWRLDARTRRVGREGVAAARRALHDAEATSGRTHRGDELSRAS